MSHIVSISKNSSTYLLRCLIYGKWYLIENNDRYFIFNYTDTLNKFMNFIDESNIELLPVCDDFRKIFTYENKETLKNGKTIVKFKSENNKYIYTNIENINKFTNITNRHDQTEIIIGTKCIYGGISNGVMLVLSRQNHYILCSNNTVTY